MNAMNRNDRDDRDDRGADGDELDDMLWAAVQKFCREQDGLRRRLTAAAEEEARVRRMLGQDEPLAWPAESVRLERMRGLAGLGRRS